jgi:hypothetical protein
MVMTTYTPEQHEVLDWASENDGILLVHAGAGTGKSFMSREVVELLNPGTCLYTAFNKAIVQEGVKRFKGFNVECKTLHALAWRYVRPKREISDISYSCITERIPYKAKKRVINAINEFYVSASADMYEYMEEEFSDKQEKNLLELAIKYIEKMIDGEISPTFNFMLKYFHLCLVEGTVDCSYDLVILDEINDTTAVSLEIFKLINAPKKIGLGETNQAIYDFLNLVDGFELLEGQADVLPLTQSFRCSTRIAKNIQTLMRRDVNEKFTFVGTDEPVMNGLTLYCTRTNAEIIREISECLASNKGFTLLRNISEIFAYPLAIVSAGSGKQVYQKQYKFLEDEYREWQVTRSKGDGWYSHLVTNVDDQETKSAIKLLNRLRNSNENIFELYKKAKTVYKDPKYTIATVFTSKGLEFEEVYIADDLNYTISKIIENGGIVSHDDLVAYRCYYVAASRCGKHLHNAKHL